MEWNGMETDLAHTDWSQLWSTGRSDRVASLSLSLSMTMTMTMLSYLPTPTDTLVRSSRAYTRPLPRVTRVLRRLAVVVATVVDGDGCVAIG